jgi:glycosyltransferase involved in cell wall biosynthesis
LLAVNSALATGAGRLLAVNPVNHPGGAEIVLMRLLRGLTARGWRVTVTSPGGGRLADAAQADGLDWQPLATGGIRRRRGVAAALVGWPALRRLARDCDVVYLNGTVTGRLLPALAGVGVLSVLDVNDMIERVPRFWRLADLILADSEAVAARLVALDPQLAPVVVGLAVDLDPPPAENPWAGGEGPVIGFVGRFEPRKGVHDLLAAVPAIRAQAADSVFVLIGDEPFGTAPEYTRRLLEDAAELGVQHIRWHDNAPGLMRHLDVLVLPSRAEPFGTVLAEAMAVGTPVVATAVDGLVEVVEDGVSGRLVPPGDPAALAAAVLEVLTRREPMAAAARARAQRWGAEVYVERIEALLLAGCASAGGRR